MYFESDVIEYGENDTVTGTVKTEKPQPSTSGKQEKASASGGRQR